MACFPEGTSLESGALRPPGPPGSAPGTLQGGCASISQGPGDQSRDSRPAAESWSRALQGRRTEAGHPGIHATAQEPVAFLTRGPAADHPDRNGALWTEAIRGVCALSQAGRRIRRAESATEAGRGAQLYVVQTVPVCSGYLSRDFDAERRICRGRHAGTVWTTYNCAPR